MGLTETEKRIRFLENVISIKRDDIKELRRDLSLVKCEKVKAFIYTQIVNLQDFIERRRFELWKLTDSREDDK